MTDYKVTKSGVLVESEAEGTHIAQFGAYVEVEGESARVTAAGALMEHGGTVANVTTFGVLVEFLDTEGDVPVYGRTLGGIDINRILPEASTGYALDPEYSFWSIVVPEETINYVENPSFENGAANYTNVSFNTFTTQLHSVLGSIAGSTIARCVSSSGGSEKVVRYTTLTQLSPGTYTFSLYVHGLQASLVGLRCGGTTSGTLAATTFPIDPWWQRLEITFRLGATDFVELELYSPASAGAQTIFTDAWQLEKKGYATTYVDGDIRSPYEHPDYPNFYWMGERHDSPSARKIQTRYGGRIYNLSDELGFLTTAIVGAGMPPIELQTLSLADGEELYRGVRVGSRTFTITGRVFGCSLSDLHENRARLINLIRPDLTPDQQPLILIYQPVTKQGEPLGRPVYMECVYNGGLEGNTNNFYQENIGLQFYSVRPRIRDLIVESKDMNTFQNLQNRRAAYRWGEDRQWTFTSGAAADNNINDIAFFRDSYIVLGGDFLNIGGGAHNRFAVYDGSSFDGADGLNDTVNVVKKGRGAQDIYAFAGGQFTQDDALANVRRAGRYQILVPPLTVVGWQELGIGLNDGEVLDILTMPNGDAYLAGTFTQDTALNDMYYFAKWDARTDTLEALGDPGMSGQVNALALGKGNRIYLGGAFVSAIDLTSTPVPDLDSVCAFNFVTQTYEQLGAGFVDPVLRIATSANGFVYALVDETPPTIYRWNGSSWQQFYQPPTGSAIDDMEIDASGVIHVVGNIADPTNRVDRVWRKMGGNVQYHGEVATRLDIETSTVNRIRKVVVDRELDSLAVMFNNALAVSPNGSVNTTITTSRDGVSEVKPRILIYGPSRPKYILNTRTGKGIYFDGTLELEPGEVMTIELDRPFPIMYSNGRESVSEFILGGVTNLRSFSLLPGDNIIRMLVEQGTGAGHRVVFEWHDTYWSIDGPGVGIS